MGLFISFGCSFLPSHYRLVLKYLWPLLIIYLPQAIQDLTVSPRAALGKIIHNYIYPQIILLVLSATTLSIITVTLVLLRFFTA